MLFVCCCCFCFSLHPVSKSAHNKLHHLWISNQLFQQTIHLMLENKVHKRIHINECKFRALAPSLSVALTKAMVHHLHQSSGFPDSLVLITKTNQIILNYPFLLNLPPIMGFFFSPSSAPPNSFHHFGSVYISIPAFISSMWKR